MHINQKKDENFEEFGAGKRNSLDTNPSESSAWRPPVGGDAEWSGSSEKMKGEGGREAGIESRSMSSSPPSADMAAVAVVAGTGSALVKKDEEGQMGE